MTAEVMLSTASLSPDERYRYELSRKWADGPQMTFVMLNPSTADASRDDPTVRRCIGFARREGCGQLEVVNLYALRATKPADLWRTRDPVGPLNDSYLRSARFSQIPGDILVAAWGAHAKPSRVAWVLDILGPDLMCLAVTKDGAPGHPLRLPADSALRRFPAAS